MEIWLFWPRWYNSPTMARWDVHKPPMSLDDSERLLRAENYRLKSREEWSAMRIIFGAVVPIVVLVASVVMLLVGWLGK